MAKKKKAATLDLNMVVLFAFVLAGVITIFLVIFMLATGNFNLNTQAYSFFGRGMCSTQYSPVCGTNGRTYTNSCFAKRSGVGIAYPGKCGSPSDTNRPSIQYTY